MVETDGLTFDFERALGWPPGYSGVTFADPEVNHIERQRAWAMWDSKQQESQDG